MRTTGRESSSGCARRSRPRNFRFLGTMIDPQVIRTELGSVASAGVEFISDYRPDELPGLLADCTAGAFPSYVEGFGLAVLEQLAAGLPTVAYDTAGPRDILAKRLPELLVPSGDIGKFADAICDILILGPDAFTRLSRTSIATAAEFSWPEIARHTLREYRKLLGCDRAWREKRMNAKPLVVITTRLPPATCGIGTHSWLLRKNWPNESQEVEFLVVDDTAGASGVMTTDRVTAFQSSAGLLSRELDRVGVADVLLHYAGRAYQRFGCPVWLPGVLANWKRKFPGSRLMIFVHEMPGDLPMRSRHFWLGKVNAWTIGRLAAIADVLVTNTASNAARLRKISGRADIHLVPVGSNIETAPESSDGPRARTEFALFGLSFGRLQTLQLFDAHLRRWKATGRMTKLHLIGPDGAIDLLRKRMKSSGRGRIADLVVRYGVLPSLRNCRHPAPRRICFEQRLRRILE